MLVLTRKTQQQIKIGDNITITIVRVTGQSVRVGIEAPESVKVVRGELLGTPAKATHSVTSDSEPVVTLSMNSGESAAVQVTEPRTAPLASRCRNRLSMPAVESSTASSESKTCVEDRRSVSGARFAPVIRRPQRLGPASVGALCRSR
jgi:carbon storage regulator